MQTAKILTVVLFCALLCGPAFAAEGDSNYTNLVASGDITAGDDLTVIDDATIGGDLSVTGAFTVGSYVATKRMFIPAMSMKLPSANPAGAAEQGSVGTLSFADSSADDHAWISIPVPDDCNPAVAASLYVHYVLPSGTAEEGTWNFQAVGYTDGTTMAAADTDLTTVFDTPRSDAEYNITTATAIPASMLNAGGIVNVVIYHDVDDQFGGTAELIGVQFEYTSNKP